MLENLSVKQFTYELADGTATPGGGAAAALAASLAAALNSMVYNFTVGKKIYNDYSDDIRKLIDSDFEKNKKLMENFLLLMDKDANAFKALSESYKLKKDTEKEADLRKLKIQESLKNAAGVPMKLAELGSKVYEALWTACKYGNKNLISDAGVAVILLHASVESSILNVKINLKSIADEEFNRDIKQRCKLLLEESEEWKKKILEEVHKSI